MKKIITLGMLFLLLLSGCGKSEDPKEMLKNAYEKQAQLSTYTYDGTMNVTLGGDGEAGFSVPINMTMMYDNKGSEDLSDDEGYSLVSLSLFGQTSVTESWTVGKTIYTDDGTSKTVSEIEVGDSAQNMDEMISAIIDNAESITVEKDGDNKILHVTVKEGATADVLAGFGDGLSDLTGAAEDSNITFNDIVFTIDKEGYIRSLSLSAKAEAEELAIDMDIELNLKDEGKTVIPAFDPTEFTDQASAPDYTDTIEDDYGNGRYEDIVFDDGVEILVYMDQFDDFMCYFDDDSQYLTIFNDDEILCDGIFVNGDFAQQLYDAITAGDVSYTIRYESEPYTYGGNAKMLVGYSPNESELFNPETPFSVITFDKGDLGLIFVGYKTEEDFKAAMDQISYDLYTEQ